MKPDLQAKFLQHLSNKRKSDEGFTLIELLVVIIIIGILAAIALPSLLGQVNKARQAEARQNIGALNRAQQAYHLEFLEFASQEADLGISITTGTGNYEYTFESASTFADDVTNKATAQKASLKSYYGSLATELGTTSEVTTVAVFCEAEEPGTGDTVTVPTDTTPEGGCDPGFKEIGGAPN